MRFRELFNKKGIKWSEEQQYDVGTGKTDNNAWAKIFIFLPVALAFSSVLIIIAVIGIPKTMDVLKSALASITHEEVLKEAPKEALFSDVKADSKYFDSLVYLKKSGVISGFNDNTFRPYQELRRAELIKMIASAKKLYPLALNYNSCFKDVKNEWYAATVCLAKEKGWVSGYSDGSFHPEEALTKSEALKMIMAAFAIVPDPTLPVLNMFGDLDTDAWYYPYVRTALSKKLIDENPDLELYKPDSPALRGDVAQVIYRVLQQA